VLRLARASFQAGRVREAAGIAQQALDDARARGDDELTVRALLLLTPIMGRLASPAASDLSSQALRLTDGQPGTLRLEALSAHAGVCYTGGSHREALAAVEEALTLASELGVPVPGPILGVRALSSASLGDPGGLADAERALAVLVERGTGRDVAILTNNLAIVYYALTGPAEMLARIDDGVRFCQARGLGEVALALEGMRPALLTELGRTDEALDAARAVIRSAEAAGDDASGMEARGAAVALLVAVGQEQSADVRPAELLAHAHHLGGADDVLIAGAPAAALAAALGSPEEAAGCLDEIARAADSTFESYFARHLPGMVRVALSIARPDLAAQLADARSMDSPAARYARASAHAAIVEHDGRLREASTLYREALEGWRAFGHLPEEAYALLGLGRALAAVGDADAQRYLDEARGLFERVGYAPALAQVGALTPSPSLGSVEQE
jgi:tetratricopeptide (TPR) repeat protein